MKHIMMVTIDCGLKLCCGCKYQGCGRCDLSVPPTPLVKHGSTYRRSEECIEGSIPIPADGQRYQCIIDKTGVFYGLENSDAITG